MKRLVALALAVALLPAAKAANVGVTVEISQPGVYGRVDIGRLPPPAVIVPQPVIIAPPPAVAATSPIYMWVPPGHQKNWGKHCHRYNACGVPVYFVRHDWYEQHVHHKGKHRGRGKGRGDD